MALSASLKEHTARRAARVQALSHTITRAVVAADELENDCRACLGLELMCVLDNQRSLDAAVKRLQTQVAAVSKTTASYNAQTHTLMRECGELEPLALWLEQSEHVIKAILDNFDYVENRLTAEN